MILITGAGGLIGSNLVWALNKAGRSDLLLIDDFGKGDKYKNISGLMFSELLPISALQNMDYLSEKCTENGVNTVIHMGAISDTTETDMDALLENNYNLSKSMLYLAYGIGAKFIYASSAATYGDGSQGFAVDASQISSLRPLNKYGYSKQLFDTWMIENGYFETTKSYGLKFFNVYGPNESHKSHMVSMVYKFFHEYKADKKIKLFKSYNEKYKDGEQMRDFVYSKDVANYVISKFIDAEDAQYGIYNVGSGEASSILELAISVLSALGVSDMAEAISFVDMPDHMRKSYQYYTKSEQSDVISPDLKTGVVDYVQNYLIGGKSLDSND